MKKKIYLKEGSFLHKGVLLKKFIIINKILYRDMFTKKCKLVYTLDSPIDREEDGPNL